MIKLQNLSAGYSTKHPVLHELNTTLHVGRIYGLLGANGSGKTTLLKTISGSIAPLSGELSAMGENPIERSVAFLSEMIYLPDEVQLPSMSAKTFEKLYAPLRPQFSAEKFHNYLQRFEVDTNIRLNRLSLGNRKKFFIAFAMACNAKLLIFDEPTNGLDILGKKVFRQLLAAEINDERTIIVSTHLVSDLESIISDVIVIKDHNIVLNADVNTIAERLEFGNANAITTPIYKDGLRAIGKGDGEPTNVDLEMLYLALHDNSVKQQIIDLVSGKEELC